MNTLKLKELIDILQTELNLHGNIDVLIDHEDFFGPEIRDLKKTKITIQSINNEKKLVISCYE